MREPRPTLIISLDFELYWGMIDKVTLDEYGERILGVRKAIPAILELFEEYNLHATWAVVGMMMHESKESLLASLPPEGLRPHYEESVLSTYEHIAQFDIKENEKADPYHFGASLVRMIQAAGNQEIASHTFSHYYCIDGSQNSLPAAAQASDEAFDADCKAFAKTAERFGITARSIVFPRNQAHESALLVCRANAIAAYRGNEDHFLYKARRDDKQSLFIRGLRLLDHYVNLSGHHTYKLEETEDQPIKNIPASRFLRPYSRTLSALEPLRLRRIKNAMTRAAKQGEVFHLWWHPHNFGADLEKNMKNLREIAEHYKILQEKYGMQSLTMSEVAAFKTLQ